jgi:hypothetical protein
LKALVGTNVGWTSLQKVEGSGKVLLGYVAMPIGIFLLTSLILLLNLAD